MYFSQLYENSAWTDTTSVEIFHRGAEAAEEALWLGFYWPTVLNPNLQIDPDEKPFLNNWG